MKTKPELFSLIRPKGVGYKVNQHSPIFEHKSTKRNRSKAAKNQKAITDSQDS
jgi:hypothetical protein